MGDHSRTLGESVNAFFCFYLLEQNKLILHCGTLVDFNLIPAQMEHSVVSFIEVRTETPYISSITGGKHWQMSINN